jgi:hypothetical protein
MDYVVDRFHGRSLAIAHSQEELEELNEDSLPNEKLVDSIDRKNFIFLV